MTPPPLGTSWAQKIGLNCCRVFAQALVWNADPDGLADRLDRFLGIAELVSRFGQDGRGLGWDCYKEPGNEGRGAPNPVQPLTAGARVRNEERQGINGFLLSESDVLTFHQYAGAAHLAQTSAQLKENGRPGPCAEWMSWGRVKGRTHTHLPWGAQVIGAG